MDVIRQNCPLSLRKKAKYWENLLLNSLYCILIYFPNWDFFDVKSNWDYYAQGIRIELLNSLNFTMISPILDYNRFSFYFFFNRFLESNWRLINNVLVISKLLNMIRNPYKLASLIILNLLFFCGNF